MISRFTSCAKVRWNVSISLPSPHVPLSHRLNLTNVFSLAPAIPLSAYDLATRCDSNSACPRRLSSYPRSEFESQSTPTTRPHSRTGNVSSNLPSSVAASSSSSSSIDVVDGSDSSQCAKDACDTQWQESISVSDRLALTLEEIVHIRSVMTKAELESLPVGIRIKEDVEKRKVCFLCLRTRFTLFGNWGVQCKLCHRTVCSKCHSKVRFLIFFRIFFILVMILLKYKLKLTVNFKNQMRIPAEHFRNVPVVLLSPSLMNSPATPSSPSTSTRSTPPHQNSGRPTNGPSSMLEDSFPRTLMERLLRTESDAKVRLRFTISISITFSTPFNQV